MQKLSMFFAAVIAATLGFAGTAAAQEPPVNTIKAVGCPIEQSTPAAGGSGECDDFEAPSQDMAGFNSYLCGVADGIDADAEANGQPAPNPLSDGVRGVAEGNPAEAGDCSGDDDDDDDDDGDGNGGNGDDGVSAAQAQNAAADGSLPRTGGALPMAGFVVASLGALTRRLVG